MQSVAPGGPADKAGIRAGDLSATLDNHPIQLGGDIIIKVAGKDDPHRATICEAAVANRKSGDRVKVTLWRAGKVKTVEVTLGERPNTVDQPALTTMRGVSTDAPRIKLCGITSRDDALLAVDAGAWAVGCILWPDSPRACDPAEAAAHRRGRAPARPRLRACSSTRRSTRSPGWWTASG